MPDRGLLSAVADAVAVQEEVDWARCARRARPAERRALDQLRVFAGICRAGATRADTPARPAAAAGGGSRVVRRAIGVLAAAALVQSVVGMATGVALLPAATEGMLAALGPAEPEISARVFLPASDMTPPAAFFRILPHVLYPLCGLVLLVGGRFDRRAWLLGTVLVLLGAFWAQPVVGGLGVGLYPELFLPAVLWMFVREYPRVRRHTRLDDAAAAMAVVAAAVGGALQLANLPPVQALGSALAVLAREVPGTYVAPLFFGPHCVLVLAALAVLLVRACRVEAGERTRTWLFVGGIVAALAPHLEGAVEAALPGTVDAATANWISVVGSVSTLAVPCLTLYAAIALRVLDVRTTVRVSVRRLLTRGGLAALIAGPLAALAWLVASRADQPVGQVVADPLAGACLAGAGTALAALAFRERLLARLDAWVTPETADQRRALAAAGADLGQAGGLAEVARVVARAARWGAGVRAVLLAAGGTSGARDYACAAPDVSLAPLPRTSALVHVLEQVRAPLQVHPDVRPSAFDLLPPGEAAWVAATAAAVVAPVAGPGAALAGLLVVGRRADAGRLRPVDLTFLAALAAAAGLALERLRLEAGSAGREAPPASECRACGRVAEAAARNPRCPACGAAWVPARVPAMLAGKFVMERRIGAGGMGTVYLARDVGLDRPVAVKTLDGVSPADLARLKTEAQAMAALVHPGIAQIHGLETWAGRPLLVMEHLGGGTLAARIARGPLAPEDAAGVALAVAAALGTLHAAGYRHGDVKPSNIAFTAEGEAKLLDFGLAEPAGRRDGPAGGTAAYLSPEVLGGAPAAPADDVWALAVVLYEMITGQRPFTGATVDELADRIRRRRPGPLPAAPDGARAGARADLLTFAGGLLTARLPDRPKTPEAFAAALRARLHRPPEAPAR